MLTFSAMILTLVFIRDACLSPIDEIEDNAFVSILEDLVAEG